MPRFVRDSQTPVLKCMFYNLAFIKWLCGESSEDGAGCLIIQTGTQTQVKGSPINKKNKANQVRTALACIMRYGRKGRTGKLSTPG